MTLETGDRGTTLVELCVALAILALVTAIAWPRWNDFVNRSAGDDLRRREIESRRHAVFGSEDAWR